MNDIINEFMWRYQGALRAASREFVNACLTRVGVVGAAPLVLFVGFREGTGDGHPVCVEPETSPLTSALFTEVLAQADGAFDQRPDQDIIDSDPDLAQRRLHRIQENYRRRAIVDALQDATDGNDRYFFAGYSAVVSGYRVYPLVGVLRTRWDRNPASPVPLLALRQTADAAGFACSLQEGVLRRALSEISLALEIGEEPQGLRDWASELAEETVRHAAQELMRGIVTNLGSPHGDGLFDAMNAISAQPYEGRTGAGTLLLCRANGSSFDIDVKFESAIPLAETRAARKALEMTGKNLMLLTDGVDAFGLGRPIQGSGAGSYVTVAGRGQWRVFVAGEQLMEVDSGHAALPREPISRGSFVETIERLFGADGDTDKLWEVTDAARKQQHGTMLVVHRDAAGEAKRLAPQALAISPQVLTATNFESLTAIDGAILLSPDGRCHAVGVILDGKAAARVGDPSRGARFNSAVRYHEGSDQGTVVIVIISEDGMINVLPNLPRRVHRSEVDRALSALDVASMDPVNFETAAERSDHVRALGFYLSAGECERANAAFERVESAREARGGSFLRVRYEELAPSPKMNDSYLLADK